MTFQVEFHPLARKDYIDAYNWYEDKRGGLGERFILEMRICLEAISKNPLQFSIKKKKFREARIAIFPYNIVYEVYKTEGIIHVAAVYHGKRNPRRKFRRRV